LKFAERRSLLDEDWGKTLFGPKGILTALFKVIDGMQKRNKMHDVKPIDFAKFFDAFLINSKEGFDPLIELPEFLGICNRLSCGDIYKAIDQFRKSELFSNFQTALQLIQDPKGWEIIGEFLSNPDMIAQFTGDGLLGNLFGSSLSNSKGSEKITPEDGDFGTDFSSLVGSKPFKERKPTPEEWPEIAENVDSEDYYNAVCFTRFPDKKLYSIYSIVNSFLKKYNQTSKRFSASKAITTRKFQRQMTTKSTHRQATKNFRKESDYYAMYYDDIAE
uniref:EF-hand domain-containing protein n=1 Tax=Dracunculus medinensis TaxID=318479 RepID=A0A0N4UJU7_DRAME